MKTSRPLRYAAIAAILIAYIAVRFWNLTSSCLWFDEIFGIHAAEHSWDTLFSFVARDLIHPPLFYALLKTWIAAGGESLLWLRFFPMLFSALVLIPFYFLCREFRLSFLAQILALLFFAVNGSLIKYAQEVRMYSLLLCLSLFSLWLFVRYFNTGKRFLPLVIVNILLVYTHYFGWLVVLTEVTTVLIFQRIKIRRILLMFGIVFASFLPWIYAVWQASLSKNSDFGQNIGWMERPGIAAIVQFILNLSEPFYYAASNIDAISIYRVTVPILLLTVTAIVLLVVNRKQESESDTQNLYLLGLFALLPIVIVFAASWVLPYSIWGTRHLIIVFPPLMIIGAIAISKISIEWLKIATVTLVFLLAGYGFALQTLRPIQPAIWCAWETFAPIITTAESDTAAPQEIYAFEDLVAYHLWFATRNNAIKPHISKIEGIEGINEDKAYFLPRGFDEVGRTSIENVKNEKIWIAFRAGQFNPDAPLLRNFIARGYVVAEMKSYETSMGNGYFVLLKKER